MSEDALELLPLFERTEEEYAVAREWSDLANRLPVEIRKPFFARFFDDLQCLSVRCNDITAVAALDAVKREVVEVDRYLLAALRAGDEDAIWRYIHDGSQGVLTKIEGSAK